MKSNDAEASSQRGLDQLAAGSPAEAVLSFRAAMTADPNHIEAHHGLIRALRDAGRLEQAIGAALALTALTPSDPLAHTALSISLHRQDTFPKPKPPPPAPESWSGKLSCNPPLRRMENVHEVIFNRSCTTTAPDARLNSSAPTARNIGGRLQTPLEVILGAYLTQNTSWKAVEISLTNLRNAGALDLERLRSLSIEQLRRTDPPVGLL